MYNNLDFWHVVATYGNKKIYDGYIITDNIDYTIEILEKSLPEEAMFIYHIV